MQAIVAGGNIGQQAAANDSELSIGMIGDAAVLSFDYSEIERVP